MSQNNSLNIIKQIGDENRQMIQLEGVILIQHQILLSNLQGSVLQLGGRITSQILGVKEWYLEENLW